MMSAEEEIRSLARRLKLPAIADYREHLADEPGPLFLKGLLQLLQAELAGREERSFTRRLKEARFPALKTLDTYEPNLLPHLSALQIQELATCEYIRSRHNVLGVGNSGTGKTHLSMALGIEALRQGFSVRFEMTVPLLDQLVEARDNRELRQQMRLFERCDLLILDEFGYQKLSAAQASMLFQLFAVRHERKSTYVTTNLEFSKWVDVIGDHLLTAALVDRFAHKSILLNMNGPSYRLKEGRQAAKAKSTLAKHPS
jgi:DNA replication protein DnaC